MPGVIGTSYRTCKIILLSLLPPLDISLEILALKKLSTCGTFCLTNVCRYFLQLRNDLHYIHYGLLYLANEPEYCFCEFPSNIFTDSENVLVADDTIYVL